MRIQTIVGLTAALLALGISAGCVAPEEYQSVDPRRAEEGGEDAQCRTPYITMHYVVAEPVSDEAVRDAFISAGYEWNVVQQGVATAQLGDQEPTQLVVSYDPGTSGEDLLVSALGVDGETTEIDVTLAANAADEVVLQAFPNATAGERIEGAWSGACGEPPDPVAIGRADGGGGAAGGGATGSETDYQTDAGEPRS